MGSKGTDRLRIPAMVILISTVILMAIGVGVGVPDAVAQGEELDEVAGSAADSDVNLIPRTGKGEEVTIEVGETLVVGFSADEQNSDGLVIAESTDVFQWDIHEASKGSLDESQLLYTGPGDIPDVTDDITPRDLPNERVTSFRPTEPGTYVIEVETPKVDTFRSESPGGTHKGHTAKIKVKKSADLDKLKEYAPVINFHPDEEYYPTRIEAIFDNSYLCEDSSIPGKGDLLRNMATLNDLPEGDESTDVYLQPYSVPPSLRPGVGKCGKPKVSAGGSGFPADILEEANPTNSVYPKNVYGTVMEPSSGDGDDLNFNPGSLHASEYEERDLEPPSQGGKYTALVYFMTYVNDPKPENARGGEIFDEFAAHTGDIEPVWILLDDGDPEWLLAQQHKGGEYRKWENVEKTKEGHPIIYPGEGTHGNFLSMRGDDEPEIEVRNIEDTQSFPLDNPEDYPQYVYQQQYLCPSGLCGDDSSIPRWDTTIATKVPGINKGDIDGYLDVVAFAEPDSDSVDKLWKPEGLDMPEIPSDAKEYEISVLTGNETWSDYEGSVYRYPLLGTVEGDIHHQTTTWKEPGGRGEKFLFPDIAQIDGKFSGDETFSAATFTAAPDSSDSENIQSDVVSPYGEELECADLKRGKCREIESPPPIVKKNDRVTPDETDGSVGVNVINTGMQPHEFVLGLRATNFTTATTEEADYSFYVNSIYPSNIAGAVVPLEPLGINEPGEYTVNADLSVYTDEYKLDDETFELEITDALPEPSLEIDEDETIDAGTINESRTVGVDVLVKGSDQLSGDYGWSASVEGEEVGFYDDGSLLTYGKESSDRDGKVHRVVFWAPDVDEPGTYDVRVELDTEDEDLSAAEEDLLSYSEPGGVAQTATALVLDKSGSMGTRDADGTRMSAAKDAALGVIDRQSDSDYVSVVGFSSGSRVRQGLTKLDDSRASAESAVGSLGPGGSTNIGAGLRDGIDEVMKAPEGAQKNVILMSDGGRNRGPSKSAIRGMVRNRINPNGICLQTNSLGDGADKAFMNSLADTADCSESTESDSRDEIIEDFIELSRKFDASEVVKKIEERISDGETFLGTFKLDDGTTSAILDVSKGVGETSSLSLGAQDTEHEIDVDDRIGVYENRSDAGLNTSKTSVAALTEALDRPAPEERDVRLYGPDGSIVDPVNSSEVEVSSTDDRTVYRINDPEAGEWSYEIDGGEGGTEFEARVTADSLTKLDVETSSDEYYTGTDAVLTATLFGAEPVRNADVDAEVETPNGSSKTVTLEEVSPGIYRTTVGLEEGVSGTYEATVRATQDEENVERRATTTWDAEYAAPVSVGQQNVPVVEPGSEEETEFVVKSEALLGIRSVEVGLSDFTHETTEATVPSWRVSMNRSHLIRSGENVEVDATVDVPDGTPTGTYTAEASAQVDNSGTTVDEVRLRVGGGDGTACVDRRDAGRGETDGLCEGERELGRGSGKDDGRYDRGTDRRDRGRGSERGGSGRRSRGR